MAKRKAFLLRVDPRLHDALRRWAEDDFRSLNSQVELLLRRAAAQAGRLGKPGENSEDADGSDADGSVEPPERDAEKGS